MLRRRLALLLIGLLLHSTARADCTKLMLFGGDNHTVYLGCLNCSSWDSESISNQYGSYGGKYSDESIWNKFGTYGSKTSDYSPWNQYASTPPIIVDDCGKYYGALTVNEHNRERATLPAVLGILTRNPHPGSLSGSSGSSRNYAKAPTDPAQYDNMVAPSDGEVVLGGVLEGIAAGLRVGQAKREQKRKQKEDEALIQRLTERWDRREAEAEARDRKRTESEKIQNRNPVDSEKSSVVTIESFLDSSVDSADELDSWSPPRKDFLDSTPPFLKHKTLPSFDEVMGADPIAWADSVETEAQGYANPVLDEQNGTLETSVAGIFYGWHVGATLMLANGWVVQVVHVDAESVAERTRPKVTLTDFSAPGASLFLMKVADFGQSAFVKRIK